jgi:hypothetical protein
LQFSRRQCLARQRGLQALSDKLMCALADYTRGLVEFANSPRLARDFLFSGLGKTGRGILPLIGLSPSVNPEDVESLLEKVLPTFLWVAFCMVSP